jgi:hypothetical protein
LLAAEQVNRYQLKWHTKLPGNEQYAAAARRKGMVIKTHGIHSGGLISSDAIVTAATDSFCQ